MVIRYLTRDVQQTFLYPSKETLTVKLYYVRRRYNPHDLTQKDIEIERGIVPVSATYITKVCEQNGLVRIS